MTDDEFDPNLSGSDIFGSDEFEEDGELFYCHECSSHFTEEMADSDPPKRCPLCGIIFL